MPGLGSPLLQFVNGECDQLSMELFLDDYTDPKGPTSLQQQEKDPLDQAPDAICRSCSRSTAICTRRRRCASTGARWSSTAVIEKLGRKVTMFHPDGTPARATLSVSFKEYRTLRQQLEDPRRESADKTKRRVVVGREALWLIAAREYDDAERVGAHRRGQRPRRSARHRAGRLADAAADREPRWNWRHSLDATATSTRRRSPSASGATT